MGKRCGGADSNADAQAFQLRQVHLCPTKLPPHLVLHPESHAAAATGGSGGDDDEGKRRARRMSPAAASSEESHSKKEEELDNQNEELDKDVKSGDLGKSKREKTVKGKMDIDRDSLKSKEAAAAYQNGGTLTKNKEGATHDDEIERDANVQVTRRSFDELQGLYPFLAACVEEIEVNNPCGKTLKRSFGIIGDEKAQSLESMARKQMVSEAKAKRHRADVTSEVTITLLSKLT